MKKLCTAILYSLTEAKKEPGNLKTHRVCYKKKLSSDSYRDSTSKP